MPDIEKAVQQYALDDYDQKALQPDPLRQGPQSVRSDEEKAGRSRRYGRHTFGQSLLLARRLIEAGSAGGAGELAGGCQRRPETTLERHAGTIRSAKNCTGRSWTPP